MIMRYVARRLILLVPVLLGVSVLVSALVRFAPGDPIYAALGFDYAPKLAAEMRHELGLDRPFVEWYFVWLGKVLRGDLGRSIVAGETVRDLIFDRLPNTLVLASGSMFVALVLAIPLGILAAIRRNTVVDNISRAVAVVGISMPVFWLGILLMIVFALRIPLFPAVGFIREHGIRGVVLPTIALGAGFAALIMRMTRSIMMDVLLEPYITTARAKGLRNRGIYLRHALRNALIPIITIVGFQFGIILGGAVLTETIFGIPGLGSLLIEAVGRRDYPLIQGVTLVTALMFVFANLVVDVLYIVVDPRIRYE